jgi:hypothetical protein
MIGEAMLNDEELKAKIEKVCEDYHGTVDDLAMIVGLVVVGRYYGSRSMRLGSTRRHWALMQKWFGDPNDLMKPQERLWEKHKALKMLATATDYWKVISGAKSMPLAERKGLGDGEEGGATM